MRGARELHPVAWWTWAVGLAACASLTTNPLLLALLLAVACAVVWTCRSDQPWSRSFRLYLAIGALTVVTRVVLRLLIGGDAPGHVWLDLPSLPLPEAAAGISLLGPLTREEVLAASYEGLRLATIIVAVGAANALANPKRLMKSLPPALYEVGTAMTVAITVIPQLADSARRVRAAQELRGGPTGRFARLRGLRRLLVPVLEDAFDRSLALAAGMDARGYGRTGDLGVRERRLTGALVLGGLMGVAVGVYAVLDERAPAVLARPMLAVGTVVALVGMVLAGRRVRRTRYRADRWRAPEIAVAASGVLAALGVALARHQAPAMAAPAVDVVPTVTLVALVAVLLGLLPLLVAPPPVNADRGVVPFAEEVAEPADDAPAGVADGSPQTAAPRQRSGPAASGTAVAS